MLYAPDGSPLASPAPAAPEPAPAAAPAAAPADAAPTPQGAAAPTPTAAIVLAALADGERVQATRAILRHLGVECAEARRRGLQEATVPLEFWNAVLWLASAALDGETEAVLGARDGILAPLDNSLSETATEAAVHLVGALTRPREQVVAPTAEETRLVARSVQHRQH